MTGGTQCWVHLDESIPRSKSPVQFTDHGEPAMNAFQFLGGKLVSGNLSMDWYKGKLNRKPQKMWKSMGLNLKKYGKIDGRPFSIFPYRQITSNHSRRTRRLPTGCGPTVMGASIQNMESPNFRWEYHFNPFHTYYVYIYIHQYWSICIIYKYIHI